ncbi:hypothetical protein A1O3_05558 [Capronia epimyces CBS 606.96]|uniref:Uncharacterized protein n=1 Tax=Capronia epimyces CBS 606.96 TaxID=1182542 RepID=W9XXE1_9EURO|nr:uncharacterized protein A1O3_05558 [Capronia epimyces CBS 606.96]EXJ84883.1 hypothetical protein A1O3_05558 [Capronia epimyces CBS 606.96]
MCWYKLNICPYPHQEALSALIFDPSSASQWQHCDRPHPWGRLSCGSLIVEHPKDLLRSETQATFEHILATRSNLPAEGENHPTAISVRQRRSSTETTIVPGGAGRPRSQGAPCLWCTAVLKTVATKSKEIHQDARREIAGLEQKMDTSPSLREIQREIMDKEKELDNLRHIAWRKASDLMDGETGKGEDEIQS